MTYFATDFQNVDRADTVQRFAQCLRLQQSLEFCRRYKAKTFELMQLGPGSAALDVGCGTGEDAVALAKIVGPAGRVTAVDRSRALLGEAIAGAQGLGLPILFQEADGQDLPFGADTFDAARIDRTLQHVAEPQTVIAEMARVVRPGGRVVAMEPDWGTLTVDSDNRPLTRQLLNFWCDSFPSGWVGRRLARYFALAGLVDVQVQPETLVLRQFELADQVLDLVQTAHAARESGLASEAAVQGWLAEMAERDRRRDFFSSFTAFIVSGTKP
jgi:ubiquinone/menaquinone biosynthesis C-methylase UbiE